MIATSYKQTRQPDDLNQALSVQPWGSDSQRHKYYLIEGLDDTHFRVYRESSHVGPNRTWWSVAGDIDELKVLAEKLVKEDDSQKAKILSAKMLAAVPRFLETEEVCFTILRSCLMLTLSLEEKASRISSHSQATIQTSGT